MGAVSVGTAPIVWHNYYHIFTLTTDSFQSKIIAEIIITLAAPLDVNLSENDELVVSIKVLKYGEHAKMSSTFFFLYLCLIKL